MEILGVEIKLDIVGIDNQEKEIQRFFSTLKSLGFGAQDILKATGQIIEELGKRIDARTGKMWKTMAGFKELSNRILESSSKIFSGGGRGNGDPRWMRSLQHIYTQTPFGKFILGIKSINTAFAESKAVWSYVEGIEKVNQKLLLLHYSSSIGISSLKGLGAAASVFGGSAETVASAEERLQMQIAKARRGEGFGFLQEAYWKHGFQVDLGWNAEQLKAAAIRHARTISDPADRLAFSHLINPANPREISGPASLSDAQFARWEKVNEYAKSLKNLLSADGENRGKAVGDATFEFENATAEMKLAWQNVRDQVAVSLLPIMTKICEVIRNGLDFLNKHPGVIDVIAKACAGIAAIFTGWKIWKLAGYLLGQVVPALGKVRAAMLGLRGAQAAAGLASGADGAAGAGAAGAGAAGTAGLGAAGTSAAVVASGAAGAAIGYFGIYKNVIEPWQEEQEKQVLDSLNHGTAATIAHLKNQNKSVLDRWTSGQASLEDIKKTIFTGRGDKTSSLESFEAFQAHYQKQMAFFAERSGKALDVNAIMADPQMIATMRAQYDAIKSGDTSIDNSKRAVYNTITVYEAGDAQETANKIAETTATGLGTTLNSGAQR